MKSKKLWLFYIAFKTYLLEQILVPWVDAVFFKLNKITPTSQPVCLIVKPDAIGDYVLFRSFLPLLRSQFSPFKNQRLVLLGNSQYKPIYEAFDNDIFDEVVWINRLSFCRNTAYRRSILKILGQFNIETWVYPVHNRDFHFDRLLHFLKPKKAYGLVSGFGNSSEKIIKKYSGYYTQLYKLPQGPIHELDKNRIFFSRLLGTQLAADNCINKPNFSEFPTPLNIENYFVVFPGASVETKQWPVDRFAKAANYIQEKKGWAIVIVGGPNEKTLCNQLESLVFGEVINLAGNTSLPTLWNLISKSKALLANDTVAIHLAGFFNIPTICPFNGIHFGSFVPWPRGQGKPIFAVLPNGFEPKQGFDYKRGSNYPFSIEDVTLEEAIKAINNAVEPVD